MCGLAGVAAQTVQAPAVVVGAMLDRIAHRGPDGRGVKDAGNGVVHGHVRLSLVDLTEASAQPFVRGASVLSFNGEIWNYRELRAELEETYDGEVFLTVGDTEVMLVALERWGLDGLNRLNGMFAAAWSSNGEHWLVRDSFGKVPLYVSKVCGGYHWASERKAFARGTSPVSVPPGHAFNLRTGEWRVWYKKPVTMAPLRAAEVLSHLRTGVEKRIQADVPVCVLVSGGLDSAAILALARESRPDVVAFTATFDADSDDARAARRICSELKVTLVEERITLTENSVDEALRTIEIPSKAQLEIAMLCIPLARRIYAEGFRACLSGEAADELFGGYGNFCIAASKASPAEVLQLRADLMAKMSRGNFVRCNKAFMAHGVECRLPFMEQRLAEAAMRMSMRDSPEHKKLLKVACAPILPAWVINRTKETFQGGSGLAQAMAKRVANPIKFYNNEARRIFGTLPKD